MKLFKGTTLLLEAFCISASALAQAQPAGSIGLDDGAGSSSAGSGSTWVEYAIQSSSTTSIGVLDA